MYSPPPPLSCLPPPIHTVPNLIPLKRQKTLIPALGIPSHTSPISNPHTWKINGVQKNIHTCSIVIGNPHKPITQNHLLNPNNLLYEHNLLLIKKISTIFQTKSHTKQIARQPKNWAIAWMVTCMLKPRYLAPYSKNPRMYVAQTKTSSQHHQQYIYIPPSPLYMTTKEIFNPISHHKV